MVELHQDTAARVPDSQSAQTDQWAGRPASVSQTLACVFIITTLLSATQKVAGQSDWHPLAWVSMTEGPACQKSCPALPLLLLGCLCSGRALHPRGLGGPFCYLCMWPESPSTPAHGQTTIQAEGKSHPNTTAEHTPAFSGMTGAPNLSVHKSEGRKRSNKHRCGLHVEHLHAQVIYCVSGTTPKYLWFGVLINSRGWACWFDFYFIISSDVPHRTKGLHNRILLSNEGSENQHSHWQF